MAGKRGRPRKNPLPKNTLSIIDKVEEKIQVELELIESIAYINEKSIAPKEVNIFTNWDVPITETITYFDPTLSYELSGYRPVDEIRGLDFKPEWFTESRRIKQETGKYCSYPPGTKKYVDFWTEEHRRCNEGYISHGYRITGDNYFFLNYYRLKDTNVEVAGSGRDTVFPQFFSKLYEYFHYIELCEKTKHDVCALKARGVKIILPSCIVIYK